MRVLLTAIILVPMLSTTAWSKDSASAPPKEKKVCRSETFVGSHLPHTTCHTAEEWKQIDEDNKENVRDFTDGRNNTQPKSSSLKF